MLINTETLEVFDTLDAAIEDAEELYDYGDPTNPVTWADMPYVEVEK